MMVRGRKPAPRVWHLKASVSGHFTLKLVTAANGQTRCAYHTVRKMAQPRG